MWNKPRGVPIGKFFMENWWGVVSYLINNPVMLPLIWMVMGGAILIWIYIDHTEDDVFDGSIY